MSYEKKKRTLGRIRRLIAARHVGKDDVAFLPTEEERMEARIKPAKMYDVISACETLGYSNPWIRTEVRTDKGSSAYGPAQLTKTLATDMLTRKDVKFDGEEKAFLRRFVKQGDKFLANSDNPDTPQYHYGGGGDMSASDRPIYKRVVTKMLERYIDKYDGDIKAVMKAWSRGENSGDKLDSNYAQRGYTILN